MKKIKIILLIVFSFLILSCDCENKLTGGGSSEPLKSVIIDKRCSKIRKDAVAEDRKQEVRSCALKQDVPENVKGRTGAYLIYYNKYYITPEKCKDFWHSIYNKCKALPPPGPGDIDVLSGNAFFKDGKLVAVDGEPVCN